MLRGIKRSAFKRDLQLFLIPWVLTMTLSIAVALWDFTRGGNSELIPSTSTVVGLVLMICGFPFPLIAAATLRGVLLVHPCDKG